jgi:hypothetical protein
VPAWVVATGVTALFLGLVGWAKLSGHWDGDLPVEAWYQLVKVGDAPHP